MTGETMVAEMADGAGLSGDALTEVGAVRAYLGLKEGEGDDRLIIDCINEASAWIERVTGRSFKVRERAEFLSVEEGQGRLKLAHMPVVGRARVHAGPVRGLEVRRVHAALEATAAVGAEGVVLRWVDALGGEREVLVGVGGGRSLRDVAREISGVAGWSASAAGGWGAEMLIPGQVVDAQGEWGGQLMACVREVGCRVLEEGVVVLERPLRRAGVVRVGYRAGYEVVPREVEALCVRLAGERWRERVGVVGRVCCVEGKRVAG